jgi:hypothetical protein
VVNYRGACSRLANRRLQGSAISPGDFAPARALLDEWSDRLVTVKFKDGSERTGMLLNIPEERAFHLFGPHSDSDDYRDTNHPANQLHFVKDVSSIRAAR